MGLKSRELEPNKENLIKTLERDLLERNDSIIKFAQFCDAQEGKCSIAIDAGWGFGKTFFIKQTKLLIDAHNRFSKALTEDERVKIHKAFYLSTRKSENEINLAPEVCIYYDAWANDNDVDPILSLVYAIMQSTACDYDCKRGLDCIKTATQIVDFFSGKNTTAFLDLLREKDPLDRLKNQKEIHMIVEDFLESLLYEQGNRLIVFIDELDRCKPSYAVQLLERIKHYFSNERITFVFSVNIDELQHTIRRYYGEDFDACRYLDRFFDYRLSLPAANMTRFYQELGIEGDYYVFESVCKAVIEKHHFGLREVEKFYRMAKIAAYKPTHRRSQPSFSDRNALQFGLCISVPVAIGLKMVNTSLYNDFIAGNNADPLIDILESGDVASGYCAYLLENNETYYEDPNGNKKLVRLSDKISAAYHALFFSRKSESPGEIVVGQCCFSKETKDAIIRTISLLSEFSTYE